MHTHNHARGTGWVLQLSLAATLAITVFEVWAGLRAHSLAILSDAGHNLTDGLALLLAAIGLYLQEKPADQSRTYGYQRAGVLAAFVNALTLVHSVAFYLLGSRRTIRQAPEQVNDEWMMIVAVGRPDCERGHYGRSQPWAEA